MENNISGEAATREAPENANDITPEVPENPACNAPENPASEEEPTEEKEEKAVPERYRLEPQSDYFKKIVRRKLPQRFFMRAFDIVASFLGLSVLFLPFLIIALAIKCDSKGEVFFRQTRVGKNGKNFRIFKFRTMVKNAESKGLQISTGDDMRITKVGKVLRKLKIDELPQLINVLIGQMSLVGPRPEVPHYVEMYDETQRNVLLVRPGITDEASIRFRNENDILSGAENPEEIYVREIMPIKLEYNLHYIEKMGLFYNIGLIFKTIFAILK